MGRKGFLNGGEGLALSDESSPVNSTVPGEKVSEGVVV